MCAKTYLIFLSFLMLLLQPIPYIGSIPGGKLTPGFQIVIQGVAPSHSEG